MSSALADALARHLLQILPPDEPVGRAALDRLPLPVAHYLSGVMQRRLATEAALPDSDWFDADAEIVKTAAASWKAATRSAARIPATVWEAEATDAAHQVVAYLTEPVATLLAHVYTDAEVLPTAQVRERTASFSAYPYLREIAEGYLDRKGLNQVSRPEFERLLQRIDQRMVGGFEAADWMILLEPFFALVRALPVVDGIPTGVLQRFFRAKGLDSFAATLDGPSMYDEAALRTRLQEQPWMPGAEAATAGESAPQPALDDDLTHEPEAIESETAEPKASPQADAMASSQEGDKLQGVEETVSSESTEGEFDESEAIAPDDAAEWEDGEVEHVDDKPEDSFPIEMLPETMAWVPVESPAEEASAEDRTVPNDAEHEEAAESIAEFVEETIAEEMAAEAPALASDEEPLWKRLARQQGVAPDQDAASPDEEPLWKRLATPRQAEAVDLADSAIQTDAVMEESSASPHDGREAHEGDIVDVEPIDIEPDAGGASYADATNDLTFAPPIEPQRPDPLGVLETRLLGPTATERRDWYIKHLTGGSEAEYRAVLEQLDEAETWTAATQIIAADIFRKHRVNIYSDAAISFTDAVEAHFRS